MNENESGQHLHEKARHVANFLNTLTPAQRSVVLHEAQGIWDERRGGSTEEQILEDAREDVYVLTTHWIGEMVRRLSPEALVEVVELLKGIDEEARWERLVGDMPGEETQC